MAALARRLGLRGPAMLAVALAFVALFASSPGQSFLLAVFVDDMLEGTGLSRTTFSALYAAGTVLSALASVVVGRSSDRLGLAWTWIVVALALAGACLIASVASGALVAFVALSALRAFGQGALALVATLLVARSLGAMRGRGLSVALFGHISAGIALPPLVTLLIGGVGWRSAFQVLAGAVIIVLVPLVLAVRRVARFQSAAIEEERAERRASPAPTRPSRRLRGLSIPTRDAGLLLAVFVVPGLVLTGITFHAVSLLARNGFDETGAALALTALAAASAVGTPLAGVVADRVEPRTLVVAMAAVLGAGTALLLPTDPTLAYIAFALLGIATSAFMIANGSVWARMYGTRRLGRIQGLGFAAMIGGAAIGPLPLALSRSLFDSYVPGIVLFAGLASAALLAGAALRSAPERLASSPALEPGA